MRPSASTKVILRSRVGNFDSEKSVEYTVQTFKSSGIVFRSMKYSESSLILDVFTRAKGLRSFIVSGVHSKKGKTKAALFQHSSLLSFVGYDKRETLARFKEVSLAQHYQGIPYDVVKSSVALFMIDVCKHAIREREANEPLYDFIQSSLLLLDQCNSAMHTLFAIKFVLDLSAYLGFQPMDNYSEASPIFDLYDGQYTDQAEGRYCCTPTTSQHLYHLAKASWTNLADIKISKTDRERILDDLITYYRLHIDQFEQLKSLEVLRAVF